MGSFIFKPVTKFLIKNPILGAAVLLTIYVYIAYRCLLSAWESNYRRTATTDEITERWQRQMAYTRRK